MTPLHDRPAWVANFNQFGPACGDARHLIPLDSNELINAAQAATGHEDFGEGDWQEDLEALIWSLNEEAGLHTLGRFMVRAELLRTLQVRLRLNAFWQAHPEIFDAEVRAPIVIAGAARTGTSILQEVLSEDQQFHLPYTWRVLDPLPLSDNREADIQHRIKKARCEAEFWVNVQPEIRAQHDFGAILPTECLPLLAIDYCWDYWGMVADMPTWEARRMEKGYFVAGYQLHKRLLQTMQYREPDHKVWLLKSPAHLAFIDVMKDVYPDVRFIHTHRDPVKCIPSTASTTSTVRWERSDQVDCKALGETVSFGFRFAMENVIDQRVDGRLPESHITDVHLQNRINDPVGSIQKVYSHFGLKFSNEMPDSIQRYLSNKPKGKFGSHDYDISRYGMSVEGLRDEFRPYTDHYKVALEE
jgi:hypothetical protein